ncbi:hypothetical protein [Jannaschia sp. M317]|uniref:hypothetical protein n=1 Tax=Jannaschia sp. M317 TaxID=2867011 RepID=UPI0021A327A8|nr:hypothetical protein [Jannaschia sp. M317]UWQ18446.1 hypothetical protein K3551_03850 [Jannaschia sp. M317]
MLLRRSEDPSPARTPAEKAQALLALLGEEAGAIGVRGTPPGAPISDDHLRRMARDLISQVEARPPKTTPAEAATDPGPGPKRTLFRNPAPLAQPMPETASAPRAARAPAPEDSPAMPARADLTPPRPERQARLSVPRPFAPPAEVARPAPVLPMSEVRRLIAEGVDAEAPGREHPAVVALTLDGLPPLEQAAALRRLPRGQVRAVHRALRLLEMA